MIDVALPRNCCSKSVYGVTSYAITYRRHEASHVEQRAGG